MPSRGLECQVETRELRVLLLEQVNHAQRLPVVLESTVRRHAVVQGELSGMAEGCVSEVVGE